MRGYRRGLYKVGSCTVKGSCVIESGGEIVGKLNPARPEWQELLPKSRHKKWVLAFSISSNIFYSYLGGLDLKY